MTQSQASSEHAVSGRLSPLASMGDTRAVLERFGLAAKKSFGQNFLINDAIVRKIVALAELGPTDPVVEIGPGIGTLTAALLQKAERVVSIERDAALEEVLAYTCEPWRDRFTLVMGDALEKGPDDLPFAPTKLVSNLPYAVAATVVLDYLERFTSLQQMTVMVQAEVADRMMAKVGTKNYGAYTVKLALLARPVERFAVGSGNFFPAPHVQSAVIRLDRVSAQRTEEDVATAVMADAAFASRRKTIANSFRAYFGDRVPSGTLAAVLEEAGIDPRRRGETLSVQEFRALGAAALAAGIAG